MTSVTMSNRVIDKSVKLKQKIRILLLGGWGGGGAGDPPWAPRLFCYSLKVLPVFLFKGRLEFPSFTAVCSFVFF